MRECLTSAVTRARPPGASWAPLTLAPLSLSLPNLFRDFQTLSIFYSRRQCRLISVNASLDVPGVFTLDVASIILVTMCLIAVLPGPRTCILKVRPRASSGPAWHDHYSLSL